MAQTKALTAQKKKFSVMIQTDMYKNLINNTLGDKKKAERFVTAISSSVSVTPALQDCDAGSVLTAALLGESLGLSPSPQLGQYYMVPFNNSKKGIKEAQFQLGYKGYIQLAIRSGQYKKLNVIEIKEGELIRYDELNEEIEVNLIPDPDDREAAETVGYYAMLEYTNGFRKTMYWSKKKMLAHADKYSMAFKAEAAQKIANHEISEKDMWKYSSFWYDDFDGMAKKTMLRQLISKWGIMSIEMQNAIAGDYAVIGNDMQPTEYVESVDKPDSIQQDPTPQKEPIETESVELEEHQVSINDL